VFSIAVLTGLFILFRQMEHWLHQHIFKVGWLLTRNSRVTTVLYYTLFIPGILLHELVSWLVAGVLNVHATQSVAWPQSQEVGELRLNFVRISPNAPSWKKFVITLSPLVAGMLVTWYIAENVYQLDAVFAMMSSGSLVDIGAAFERLLSVPDFWLWFYLLFTISNTMFASLGRSISTLRSLSSNVLVIAAAIIFVGVTSATFSYVSAPFENALSVLSELLVVLIAVNLVATLFLGTVESLIERFSDYSITFRGGRMEVVPRQHAPQEQRSASGRTQQRTARPVQQPKPVNTITSVYKLAFPVPGAPAGSVKELLKPETKAQPRAAEEKAPAVKSSHRPASTSSTSQPPAAFISPAPVLPQIGALAESLPAPAADTPPEEPVVNPSAVPEPSDVPKSSTVSPFNKLAVGPYTAAEDKETTGTTAITEPSDVPDNAAVSPSDQPVINPFVPVSDKETDSKVPVLDPPPALSPSTVMPFGRRLANPSTVVDDERTASGLDLPDPLAEETLPAKPAAPRNPIYNRASSMSTPFGFTRPNPKTANIQSDEDGESVLAKLMGSSKEELSYGPDEDYYSEGDDEYLSSAE
jgi:hypothetical protein